MQWLGKYEHNNTVKKVISIDCENIIQIKSKYSSWYIVNVGLLLHLNYFLQRNYRVIARQLDCMPDSRLHSVKYWCHGDGIHGCFPRKQPASWEIKENGSDQLQHIYQWSKVSGNSISMSPIWYRTRSELRPTRYERLTTLRDVTRWYPFKLYFLSKAKDDTNYLHLNIY